MTLATPATPETAKDFATLQAQAALGGIALDRTDHDDGRTTFHVARWNLSRELRTLDEVGAFLRSMGIKT